MSSESDEEIVLGCLQLVLSSPKSQHKRVLILNNGFHELRDQTSLLLGKVFGKIEELKGQDSWLLQHLHLQIKSIQYSVLVPFEKNLM